MRSMKKKCAQIHTAKEGEKERNSPAENAADGQSNSRKWRMLLRPFKLHRNCMGMKQGLGHFQLLTCVATFRSV